MENAIEIRTMQPGDLEFADSLRALAGWNQTMTDWRRLLRFGGEGCFVANWNGVPAGVVTTTIYSPELAWIGMALVHPDFRRRGLGGTLLERAIGFLRALGAKRIKLDATPQGRPNYLRLGFCDEWTLTRWEGIAAQGSCALADGVRPCRSADLARIEELDASALGVHRAALFEAMLREGCLALVHEHERGGLDGFGMAREGARAFYFGPLVARSADVALRIAGRVFEHLEGERVFWDVPDEHSSIAAWAGKQGFTPQRQLTRMVLGEGQGTCGKVEMQFGIAGPEWG